MMIETVPSGTILHGRYRIERVLGSGGFGHVYLAVDIQTNQQYAIKEYLVSGSNGQVQLQHEAHVLSQLHHPNLPAFHAAFSERNRYYVVLSYIEGNDLTDMLRITRQRNDVIPIERIMGWILSICDAVQFLHSQQPPVIHRDIKPDNIRITPNGTAILVDLGNAKSAADGARTLFFIRHQGTPGYAPQEQYPGGAGTDARSDVYALGGTLFFALTSQEPPSVSTRNQQLQQKQPDLPSLQEILAHNPPEDTNAEARQFRLGVSKPAKPAPRHIRHIAQLGTLPPQVLEQLNNIIRRAMAMRPKDRYHSVTDFSNDLRKVMAALPAPQQQTPAARPADPNSTQPDLPMLYEAIQAAKENQATVQSTPHPAVQPAASPTCPRCGAAVLPQASFCPQCGSALNNPANAAPRTSVAIDQNINTAASQQKTPSGMHQQVSGKVQVQTSTRTPYVQQTPSVKAALPSTPVSNQHTAIPPVQRQQQMMSPGVSGQHVAAPTNNPQPQKASGFTTNMQLFTVVIILLVLLIVILIVLLTTQLHQHGIIHHFAHPLLLDGRS